MSFVKFKVCLRFLEFLNLIDNVVVSFIFGLMLPDKKNSKQTTNEFRQNWIFRVGIQTIEKSVISLLTDVVH